MNKEATCTSRVRASQSGLRKALENLHHIVIFHRRPFSFLSQATPEGCFLIDGIKSWRGCHPMKYNNGDQINGSFQDKDSAIRFLANFS